MTTNDSRQQAPNTLTNIVRTFKGHPADKTPACFFGLESGNQTLAIREICVGVVAHINKNLLPGTRIYLGPFPAHVLGGSRAFT
jgi:hypothetical protein